MSLAPLRFNVTKHFPECSRRGDRASTSPVGLLPEPPSGRGVCAFSMSMADISAGEGRLMRLSPVERGGEIEDGGEKEREKKAGSINIFIGDRFTNTVVPGKDPGWTDTGHDRT